MAGFEIKWPVYRLHEMLADRQTRAEELKREFAEIQGHYEQAKAELPLIARRNRRLKGPTW